MSDIPRLIKHCLNPEWVKLQFKNEDCELLNEYESQNKLMRYKSVSYTHLTLPTTERV